MTADPCRATVQLAGGAFQHGRIVSCTRPRHGIRRGLRWPELGPASNGGYYLGALAGAGIGSAGFGVLGLLLVFPLAALGAVLGDLADQKAGVKDTSHTSIITGHSGDGRQVEVEVRWNAPVTRL